MKKKTKKLKLKWYQERKTRIFLFAVVPALATALLVRTVFADEIPAEEPKGGRIDLTTEVLRYKVLYMNGCTVEVYRRGTETPWKLIRTQGATGPACSTDALINGNQMMKKISDSKVPIKPIRSKDTVIGPEDASCTQIQKEAIQAALAQIKTANPTQSKLLDSGLGVRKITTLLLDDSKDLARKDKESPEIPLARISEDGTITLLAVRHPSNFELSPENPFPDTEVSRGCETVKAEVIVDSILEALAQASGDGIMHALYGKRGVLPKQAVTEQPADEPKKEPNPAPNPVPSSNLNVADGDPLPAFLGTDAVAPALPAR